MEALFLKNLFKKKELEDKNIKKQNPDEIDIKASAEEQNILREEKSGKTLDDFNRFRRP